ncbi:hypothetical protein ACIQCQ_31930 [Streptomyces sp. NPDC088394]|uniref:hypothetical protein n=1 Tax=Streptomyces sp. NPDC088394 TaxID=3365860 RepID=UPI0037FEAC0D
MPSRTFTVAAAVVSTVVLAAGITYASTDGSTQAEPAPARAEQPVHRAAPPARQAVPAPAPVGSESGTEAKGDKGGNGGGDEGSDRGGSDRGGSDRGGRDDEGGDRGGRDDEGGDRGGRDDEGGRGGRDDEGGGRGGRDRGHDRKRERIFFNEREYGAYPGGCVPAASGLGSSSFSIYNDSRHAVEVFRGFACDGGSPVATVGPYGSTYGVVTPNVRGGGFIDNGVAGSFRVIGHDEEW